MDHHLSAALGKLTWGTRLGPYKVATETIGYPAYSQEPGRTALSAQEALAAWSTHKEALWMQVILPWENKIHASKTQAYRIRIYMIYEMQEASS